MDKRIRRNEICIIGLPRCDFVFSSTRTCFIAYGFNESSLETSVLGKLLEERSIQPVEAGGSLAPGQSAFCAKICSKIITSQFCIVLINNDNVDGKETPNANVNMEYGLMLGFNKYVIPFQRESQRLPFNVAGLDTVKYTNRDFERLAATAIDLAIDSTRQDGPPPVPPDQVIQVFLLTKKTVFTRLNTESERDIYQMGEPLEFNLLNDFSGQHYIFFGNFTALRPELVVWRLQMLREILDAKQAGAKSRFERGLVTEEMMRWGDEFMKYLQIWVLLTSEEEKQKIDDVLQHAPLGYATQIFSMADIVSALQRLAKGSA